jgi:Bacteriophage Sf6, terminase small subunit-like
MEIDNKEHEPLAGRPTLKTLQLCKEICERVAKGETLTAILAEPGMPAWSSVHEWKQSDESFRQALMRAREQQAEVWADEIMDISDAELPTHEAIGRARLRMQSRQWLAGKYNPTYADKPTQVGVQVGVQVVLSEAERLKLLERHERAMLANQGESGNTAPTLPQR